MNTDTADIMKDVIAFITARYKNDEEATKVILGIPENCLLEGEEAEAVTNRVINMLICMSEFTLSQLGALALMLRVDVGVLIAKLGMQVTIMGEGV